LVQPALERMAGFAAREPLLLPARLLSPLGKKTGRVEFQRGILGRAADGALTVRSAGGQGSAMLGSLAASDCYIVLEADRGPVAAGEGVDVQPYSGFFRACG
jgi:molybdopterin molybdotransferase